MICAVGTRSAQSRDAIAGLAESAGHGQQLRHPHASGNADNMSDVFDRRGLPERARAGPDRTSPGSNATMTRLVLPIP